MEMGKWQKYKQKSCTVILSPDGGKDFQILAGARMCRIYEVTIRDGCTQDLACGYWILKIFWKKKQISWKTWEKNLIIKCTYLIQTNPCMQIVFTCMRSYTFKRPIIKLLTNTLYILFFITLCHLFNINSMFQKRSVDWTLPNPQEAPSLITRCKKHTNSSLSSWINFKAFSASTCLSATVEYNSFSNAAAASAFIQKKVWVFKMLCSCHLSNVQNPVDIPLYWLVYRDPYNGLV